MKFERFRILNYRNVKDSGWINVNSVTAFVGQNEAGKSNLFEALYRINPFLQQDLNHNVNEDWPIDDWGNKPSGPPVSPIVCEVEFSLSSEEVSNVLVSAKKTPSAESDGESVKTNTPTSLTLEGRSFYGAAPIFSIPNSIELGIDDDLVNKWAKAHVPKFVYIKQYEISGSQVELDQLAQRIKSGWTNMSDDDQAISVVLELAKINVDDFLNKGSNPEGRTIRSFDKRAASGYLTKQFKTLWRQNDVKFEIEIDATTLNILVEDVDLEMPIRLKNRSTGFRWYVGFAWKFTHASSGQYKNCIILLEEPGVHLHFDGQQDLLNVFENLSENNTILYTTHLASMVDLKNPERIRIVESIDSHAVVKSGIVSSQSSPMAVIEASLGLTGSLRGLLGNRQILIVEGGDDALILQKISGIFKINNKIGLSDTIYIWPATGAPKTPMYAGFAVGNKWDAGVLLDTDEAGNKAKEKIQELYLYDLAVDSNFFILQIGNAAGIPKTDAAI